MRAPDFWRSAQAGPVQRLLIALLTPCPRSTDAWPSAGWEAWLAGERAGDLRRQFRRRRRRQDPTALAVAKWLNAPAKPPFLSRGYGGALSADGSAHLVDRRRHCAAETGDEPLLLARVANTVVARDRPTGALLALAGGASLIVMDDGLQNPSLAVILRWRWSMAASASAMAA